jgi:hypothetical protein
VLQSTSGYNETNIIFLNFIFYQFCINLVLSNSMGQIFAIDSNVLICNTFRDKINAFFYFYAVFLVKFFMVNCLGCY